MALRGGAPFADLILLRSARPHPPEIGGGAVLLLRLDIAGDLAAGFYLDLAIADRAGNMAAGADEQPLADDQLTLEPAMHLGLLDRGVAFEGPALGDVQLP